MRVEVGFLGALALMTPWIAGCDSMTCHVACAEAMPAVVQSASVVKVDADPPCTAAFAPVDGGVQIVVNSPAQIPAGEVRCQVHEWLTDGTELTAQAWFSPGSGCCQWVYASGGISAFAPVGGV
jgi:hypothetical protein